MARTKSTFSVTGMLAQKRENLANARANLQDFVSISGKVRAALSAVNLVADFAQKHEFTSWSNIHVWGLSTSIPEMVVTLEGTTSSLKQGIIVDIMERAMSAGFEATGSEDYLNSWASQRTFKFTQSIAGINVEIKVVANIKDSVVCKKVQVGTKLEETAVYEIVCA